MKIEKYERKFEEAVYADDKVKDSKLAKETESENMDDMDYEETPMGEGSEPKSTLNEMGTMSYVGKHENYEDMMPSNDYEVDETMEYEDEVEYCPSCGQEIPYEDESMEVEEFDYSPEMGMGKYEYGYVESAKTDLKEAVNVDEIIKELIDTSWSGDNESQMKSVQLLKGLATSDDPKSNKFMKKLDTFTSGLKVEDFK
jgi:hypothetical protein